MDKTCRVYFWYKVPTRFFWRIIILNIVKDHCQKQFLQLYPFLLRCNEENWHFFQKPRFLNRKLSTENVTEQMKVIVLERNGFQCEEKLLVFALFGFHALWVVHNKLSQQQIFPTEFSVSWRLKKMKIVKTPDTDSDEKLVFIFKLIFN